MGEGWHNNHHHYPLSARQGFFWWEIDLTYYVLLVLEKLGLIWDLQTPPERVLHPKAVRSCEALIALPGKRTDLAIEIRPPVLFSADGVRPAPGIPPKSKGPSQRRMERVMIA